MHLACAIGLPCAARPALLVLAVAALAGGGCSELPDAAALMPPELPPALLQRVVLEGFAGAERELRLDATSARIDPVTRLARLEDVRIDLAAAAGRGPLRVTAPRGEVDLGTDAFRLLGGVVGEMGAGERFTTEAVRSDPEGRLVSDGPVELRRPNLHLTAARMRLDPGDRSLRLSGGVRARMKPR